MGNQNPSLRKRAFRGLINYIIKDEDSVVKHWLSLGADGFRLDVADELPDEFIKILHGEVKKVNPNALVLGEVWEDASNKIAYDVRRRYFTDGELDSVMNYPFRDAIIGVVTGKISTGEFAQRILTITENYPKEVVDCLMNSLSTHDTIRIMNILSGAPQDMDRFKSAEYQLSAEEINRANELIRPAALLQFFLPGSACIYYGDENGTFGFGDPFNRGYFNWYNTNNEISKFYKDLAKLKNSHPAFKKGIIKFEPPRDGVLIMKREDGESRICAIVNLLDKVYKTDKKSVLMSCNVSYDEQEIYIHQNGFVIKNIP